MRQFDHNKSEGWTCLCMIGVVGPTNLVARRERQTRGSCVDYLLKQGR